MDYKEKYEKIIKNLKEAKENMGGCTFSSVVDKIIPELKESEDEKIKEDLIQWISEFPDIIWRGHYTKDVIAWLEKQGEQKTDDKAEPKFKVGDWIYHEISGNTFHINKIGNGLYMSDEGATISLGRQNDWRRWTIQDAKDGDVLYLLHEGVEHVIIYKGLVKKNFNSVLSAYCAYNGCVHDFCFADVSSYATITSERDEKEIHPATKEQCAFLFQKMKEAGYEWDSEKKELKMIEQKPAFCHHEVDLSGCSEEYRKAYYDGWNNCNQQHDQLEAEQKPDWSREDSSCYDDICEILINLIYSPKSNVNKDVVQRDLNWIMSIKEKICPQNKQNCNNPIEINRRPLKKNEVKAGDIITYFRDGKKGIMLVSSFDAGIYPRCKWGITHIDGTAYRDWNPGYIEYYAATEEEKQQLYNTMPEYVKDWLKSLKERMKGE